MDRDSAEGGRGGAADLVSALPPEISCRIFSGLDVESLCHASVACKGWHRLIEGSERLWRRHCLAVRAVCQREIDGDRGHGYSWKKIAPDAECSEEFASGAAPEPAE